MAYEKIRLLHDMAKQTNKKMYEPCLNYKNDYETKPPNVLENDRDCCLLIYYSISLTLIFPPFK